MSKIISSFLLLFFLLSCETSPPIVYVENTKTGFVNITSDLDNAKVFVDFASTNFYSPVTIELEIGEHSIFLENQSTYSDTQVVEVQEDKTNSIYLSFSKSKKNVLLEDFANVSCDPCVISSQIIHNLKNKYSENEFIPIRFATNFPSPNDQFYLSNSSLFDNRISFYNILFAPTIIVNGTNRPISTDSLEIISAIENQLTEETKLKLSITKTFVADSIKSQINVQILSTENLDIPNSKLFVYLTKRIVEFTSPPGSNGETIFHDVVFDALSSYSGNEINILETQIDANFYFSKKIPNIEEENIEIVAFIQNTQTKEIYNSAKSN